MCTEKVGTFQLLYDPALGQTQCRDRAGIGSTGRHPEQYRKVHNIILQKMSFFILQNRADCRNVLVNNGNVQSYTKTLP